MKTILVLKGGGAKGMIQVSCMAELEKQGMDLKGTDLKVCTSVGSIDGSALALGMSAQDLEKVYPKMLDVVFDKPWYPTFPKYKRSNFDKAWSNFFDLNRSMKDVDNKLIITSVDRVEDKPHFFKSWEEDDGQLNLATAIKRSFAAPYFFGQMNDPENQRVWVDGGCGIDNLPLEYAYFEADLQGWLSRPLQIICIGTGFSKRGTPYKEASKEKTVKQLLDFINPPEGGMAREMSSWEQLDRIARIAKKHKTIKFLYYDIQIPEDADGMDKLKYKEKYIAWGKEMAKKPLIEI